MQPLFLGNLGGGELLIILIVVLLLFGGKKIPELMNGLGKGVKSFKDGMNDIENSFDTKDPQANNSKKEKGGNNSNAGNENNAE